MVKIILGCTWGFPSGEYSAPYHGISLASDVQEHSWKMVIV